MKEIKYLLIFLFMLVLFSSCLTTSGEKASTVAKEEVEKIDYVELCKFDKSSSTLKYPVTVFRYVDGDTTHFTLPSGEVVKARYLAINTPESTGKIEEWGKTASNFTKEKLSHSESIWIESDSTSFDVDATGGRYLLWVWYRNSESEDYRCLNIELLQEGLAIASNSYNNRYGEYALGAIQNAKNEKKCIYSGEKDPLFFYGDSISLTLKELRTNPTMYDGVKVSFEGVVTRAWNNSVYVEEYDEENDIYYGIPIYYGYSLPGEGLDILSVGNRVKIVGTVEYYETSGNYQVSGLQYRAMRKDDPGNISLISKGNEIPYTNVTAEELNEKVITFTNGDESVEMELSSAIQGTTVKMENLIITSSYFSEDNSVLTLISTDGRYFVELRIVNTKDKNGVIINKDYFLGKTISVKGVVDSYGGNTQIKIFKLDDILVKEEK